MSKKKRQELPKIGSAVPGTSAYQMRGGPLTAEEYFALVAELYVQSDRSMTVLACSWLDMRISESIRSRVARDDKAIRKIVGYGRTGGELGFGDKCRLAYSLEVIDKQALDDLLILANVRNLFAHNFYGYTFESEEIADRCRELKFINTALPTSAHMWVSRTEWDSEDRKKIQEKKFESLKESARERFIQTTFCLSLVIWQGTKKLPTSVGPPLDWLQLPLKQRPSSEPQ